MKKTSDIRKIAFLGDYLPRKCGIATFTTDLRNAVATEFHDIIFQVVPVNDIEEGYDYPPEVKFEISEQDLSSYINAADFLNITDVDILCIQHEFGIYGGTAGSHILALMHELRIPVVTTLHTILKDPDSDQLRVMQQLIRLSTRLVVMTNKGVEILKDVYNVDNEKIDVIPHGIPDTHFSDPNFFKDEFGVAGKKVILTFGLLSPNKGIEYALKAMPGILSEFPDTVFIVVGQTHPNLLRNEGESYRLSLERIAKDLGIQKNIVFFNSFVEMEELSRFIGAADIYLTPYLTENQITSGTLSYAFGTGNAVVSTPYWHAAELLADGRGILVQFRDSDSISAAVCELFRNEDLRHSMRKNAYQTGRSMIWGNVAKLYMKSFIRAGSDYSFLGRRSFPIRTLDQQTGLFPPLKLDHLLRMTDSTGMFQHATFTVPNFAEGYCTDDNARALLLTLMLQKSGHATSKTNELMTIYAAFLNYAFNTENGRFRNFMSFDRKWLEESGSEDSHAQSLWALGMCLRHSGHRSLQMLAVDLFEKALGYTTEFVCPRGWAFALLGIYEYLQKYSGDRPVGKIQELLSEKLLEHYRKNSDKNWKWFENKVTYANAKLPHAMILSGRSMGNREMTESGLEALEWLVSLQTSEAGLFSPIGCNGFYIKNHERAIFDQQPIEAQATISACIEAYSATGNSGWIAEAGKAFEWFFGRNALGLPLYDSSTGGCRDGLHIDRVSQNQGAESTLAFLLSLEEMSMLQSTLSSFKNSSGEK